MMSANILYNRSDDINIPDDRIIATVARRSRERAANGFGLQVAANASELQAIDAVN